VEEEEEEEPEDLSTLDYQQSVMYENILMKKGYKYYRDSLGMYQIGDPNNSE